MATVEIDQEQAVLRLLVDCAELWAWRVANLAHNAQKWDSDSDGHYWKGECDKETKRALATLTAVKSPHTQYVIAHFHRLVVIHLKNLYGDNPQ